MSLEIGQLIEGKYRIVKMIGEGGMGAVFEGENVRINRRVAIKVLHSAYTGNKEVMQRFEREAQAAGRIGNDHILEVLDLGQLSDGDHFIIMEYLDGQPLSSRIKDRGRMMPHEVAPLIRQVLVGLNAAHTAGIIHRDLKPDNIFILKEKAGKADFIKIIDFGISKFQPLSGDGMKMTRTGAVMGTPYYMSPEQASGSADSDHRSDIYAIGVILYEAVTGRVPFDAATFNQLMFKIVLSDVPPPESFVPDLDPAFSSIIAKAMSRDLAHRFQSATEFIRALDAWYERGAAVSVPPPTEAGAAGLLPQGARASQVSVPGLHQTPAPGPRTPAPGNKTAGSWATSQPEAPLPTIPKKSAAPLIAAAAGVGLLVLAGGAFAALSLLRSKPAADTTTAASGAPQKVEAPNITEPAPPPPKAEAKDAPAVQPSGSAAPASPAQAAAASTANKAIITPAQRPNAPRPPGPVAAPAKTPPPSTKPPVKGKPSGGPVDFGY